jgi:heavy metal sensor kinase
MPGFRSLRLRLTLWYVLLLAIILAGFMAAIYFTLRHNLYASIDTSVRSRADVLVALVRYDGGAPTLDGVVPDDDPNADEAFARVYDADGQLTFDTTRAAVELGDVSIDSSAVEAALAGASQTRVVDTASDTFRSRMIPLERDGRIVGVLEVAETQDDASETLRTLLVIFAIAYPLTLAVASLGGIFLAGRALAPIDRLTQMARRITAHDLSQRLDLDLPDDEVGRLARTFDEMIARLDDAFRRQREFTADASHELRTPLTAIKGQIEVALNKPRDAASYQDVLRAVNDEVDRLIKLVASLLTLARADAGQIPLAVEPVETSELVAAAAEYVRPVMSEREIELRVEPGPDATLQADEDLMLQLLLNLLDNAAKHTPAGGSVAVAWAAENGRVDISVRDSGPGIPTEHLAHVFERFYRADQARSRDDGGAGLGLSICRWIAEAHGGSISVESTAGQGARFTVRLPASR